ncbi:nitrogenase iron-molybdenum cofactor biosynthesis protein [Pectobacterium atrosepticum SCRI1043]|uniref:Nitrogenase iron-molybdenum cofactor biosynthesis protein NifN n=1 Tax=Pectobacterium atrosepticum (strain SCRI 1043 / ATCC BAA-672) TaxID=218491 RepID=Q6D2Z6_PECAS|nr:nitrogenase iron-molybdenum cofactor biosynthesis protein NifN [Pectobacterium atrosepticum]GKV84269.1 nitrogenase molybdenum-cofactor biosynthesis protein NifN [Pectobacterium carotovorum subsp. carotovorum]ATY91468.1 nitrogenase iron-molybdenum cofactor biosynthesis protein NifN [Pectobacterium atrosepticum]KFX17596.1 nitrogenase iron-molybdenum cofactor biosynthesis protein NifN [Pectobacterium atrosepticum]KFX26239.1 nitrogenase iron-molybdenum cofactor biosynthesis protein NifN [Pectoba
MAQVIRNKKPLATSPIKSGQPLGAILASQGIEHCIPLVHGAQGCSAFAKVFFIQHFHDPIPLQSTGMDPTTTVMGSDSNILTALSTLCQRNAPKAIVIISTGLSEAQGSDMTRAVSEFRADNPRFKSTALLTVNTPDFYGSLENGYSAVLEGVITQWIPEKPPAGMRNRRVNLLLSHVFTPGDVELIRSYVEAFGLQPILLPDLSQSLDGHLASGDYQSVTQGGAVLRNIEQMGQSLSTITLGVSLQRAAGLLAQRSRGVALNLPHLMTLTTMDAFIHHLQQLSGRDVPAWIDRQRGQLQDAMIDCHMALQDKAIALAAEGDVLAAWSDFALSQGMVPGPVVAPVSQPGLLNLPVEQVLIGDLEDMQDLLIKTPAHLLVANSHAAGLAEQCGIPLIRAGFPIYDRLGEFRRVRQGYAGMRDTLFELANRLLNEHHPVPAYHSPLRQQFPAVRRQGVEHAAC